jgi:hypothetical protein
MELNIHCQAEQQHLAIANQYSNTRMVQASTVRRTNNNCE